MVFAARAQNHADVDARQQSEATVEGVARDERRDDVLFSLVGSDKFAMTHLTWKVETDPSWPGTALYDDYEEWKTEKDEED